MSNLDVTIVGNGVFGTFLAKELAPHANIVPDAKVVILAVPADAYEEVAKQHAGKHLVNVCSVQEETTAACLKHTTNVTSIHPMFGPRSPIDGRTCIVTRSAFSDELPMLEENNEVIRIFSKICGKVVYRVNGRPITPAIHDQIMARTHVQVVKMSDEILKIVEQAADIPDYCLPTSFKRLRDMAEQFLDMPQGTRDSILSNKY